MSTIVMAMAMDGHVCAASEVLLAVLSLGALFARSGQAAAAERMPLPVLVGTSTLVLACRDREKVVARSFSDVIARSFFSDVIAFVAPAM